MKYCLYLWVIALSLILDVGCEKEEMPYRRSTDPVAGETLLPPGVYAGNDILVELPGNEAILDGDAFSWEVEIVDYYWTKISGPNSFKIAKRDSFRTKVSNLEKGVYQFELTAIDYHGLVASDTMLVIVGDVTSNPGEIVLNDQAWYCENGYCAFGIGNIFDYITPGSFFKIFVRRDSGGPWEEAINESKWSNGDPYIFYLKDGYVFIWTATGLLIENSDIKIVFD